MLNINVNEHTEKKGALTYLSWAWAWAEALKFDAGATWEVHRYGPQGAEQPCMWIGETAMVHTSVTIKGMRRECMLPVMDNRNNAVKLPDARKISDAIMRCMTKALAMHGLGLYIYAGEDLPTGDTGPAPKTDAPADVSHSGPAIAFAGLPPEMQEWIAFKATEVENAFEQQGPQAAADVIDDAKEREQLEPEHIAALWSKLGSKSRSGIKALKAAK